MKILFFNRFFHPDTSATSQIVSDLAFHLASRGYEVHAVASFTDGTSREETLRGVRVHRVAVAPSSPHGLFRRSVAYAQYFIGARRIAHRLVRPGDIVVLKTDPPLLAPAMAAMVKARDAKLVLWLQDLFPEVAKAYGVPGVKGPLYAAVRSARDRALKRADAVVPIAESMARMVSHAGAGRVHVVHNWADGSAVVPRAPDESALRTTWGLGGKFVVEYSGNFGRVHEFDTIMQAARILRGEADIAFLMVGRGPRLEDTQAKAVGLPNVRFEKHQPRELLSDVLAVADVHLSVLRPEFEGLVHPSKLYGIMAAGRPTIFVGSTGGETAAVLNDAVCGVAVAVGDGHALASAILMLKHEPARRDAMGRRARQAFENRFERAIAFARWEKLLASLSDGTKD